MASVNREDQAVEIVRAAIQEALEKMRRYVNRRLLAGKGVDHALLADVTRELTSLADAWAIRTVTGEFGKILREEATKGAVEAGDVMGRMVELDSNLLKVSLYNAKVQIKDLLEAGVKVVNRIITNAMVTGKSLREIADSVMDELVLADGKAISPARADLIARSEYNSVFRQQQKAAATEASYAHFKMTGPLDDRTAPICRKHHGQIKTAEEWEAIHSQVFVYGLHYGCRHRWRPVPAPQKPTAPAEAGAN